MESSKDVAVITDIGVDDALALVLLDKLAGERRKVIIPTFGNTKAEATGKNARDFASHMQHDWYYHEGTRLPLNDGTTAFSAEDYHGRDGLWGIRPPESSAPLKTIDHIPRSQVISLGPLTQAYSLLKSGNLKRITLMGGYFRDETGKDIRPQANIHMDIDAAERFFNKCTGVKVRVVPHNITKQVYWTKVMVESIPETSTTNAWLKNLMLAWLNNCPYDRFALHDPVVVLLTLNPDIASWARSGVKVVRGGDLEGITELSRDNPACDIAANINEPEKVASNIFNTIFAS